MKLILAEPFKTLWPDAMRSSRSREVYARCFVSWPRAVPCVRKRGKAAIIL